MNWENGPAAEKCGAISSSRLISRDIRADRFSRHGVSYLESDLFAPLIRNLPLAEWVRKCRAAGLYFRASAAQQRALRPAINDDSYLLFLPRPRGEVAQLLDLLRPAAFHGLIFTRKAEAVPAWNDPRELLAWRPRPTAYLKQFRWIERARGRVVRLENRTTNTAIELHGAGWETRVLRASGDRSLRDILRESKTKAGTRELQAQLYRFYLLDLLNLLPPGGAQRSRPRRR